MMNKTVGMLAVSVMPCWVAAQCIDVTATAPLPASNTPLTISKIQFERNDIFVLDTEHSFWFHRFANNYHVITTEKTLQDDLLFQQGEELNLAVVAETERLLRSRRYLRKAEIRVSQYCPDSQSVVVTVKTWDNWSLLPKISLGHEGGSTKANLGLAEDNLWGTGNQAQIEYFTESERDGYKLKFSSPNIGGSHWQTSAHYSDTSDGETYQFALERPFYRLNSDWAFGFEVQKEIKAVSEYALGEVFNEYRSNHEFLEVDSGWQISRQGQTVQHVSVGLTLDNHKFDLNDQSIIAPPIDRDLSQIWVSWEFLQADYKELTNFNLFNKIEDVNFGWQARLRLGMLNKGLGADSAGWSWRAELEKNYALSSDSWLVFRSRLSQLLSKELPNQQLLDTELRYVQHLSQRSVLIGQLHWTIGKNLFRDELTTIGGDDGMRAFPLYYQTGNKAVIASMEYRYITPWNVYQLFDVALASFVDAGRAWDNPQLPPGPDTGKLYGYGFGLRILPSHASRGSIISIDLAKPVSDNPEMSGWQWRLIAKKPF